MTASPVTATYFSVQVVRQHEVGQLGDAMGDISHMFAIVVQGFANRHKVLVNCCPGYDRLDEHHGEYYSITSIGQKSLQRT